MKKRDNPYKYKFEINQENCIQCDWCMKSKPIDDCIVLLKNKEIPKNKKDLEYTTETLDMNMIWIDSDSCTRCGICIQTCPVQAIERKREGAI